MATIISYQETALNPSGQFLQKLVWRDPVRFSTDLKVHLMEWVGEPTRRDPTRYQMHLISIPVFVSACVSDCIGRRVGHLAVLKTLPSKCSVRRGEERGLQRICSQISAPHSFHQQQLKDQNPIEISHLT